MLLVEDEDEEEGEGNGLLVRVCEVDGLRVEALRRSVDKLWPMSEPNADTRARTSLFVPEDMSVVPFLVLPMSL